MFIVIARGECPIFNVARLSDHAARSHPLFRGCDGCYRFGSAATPEGGTDGGGRALRMASRPNDEQTQFEIGRKLDNAAALDLPQAPARLALHPFQHRAWS